MAYQVFARKYRPQTFAEVVGQEHITRTLENAIQMGRIAQAYLFVGPRGTGKTSTARILAKALNCTNGPKADFDPQDDICVEIAEGRCMDVLEIDGASNNNVDHVRDLRDNVRYSPTLGKYKIYIIDEVHMLSTAAFNALLKTLEEPPGHVKFIFATTEAHKLPQTILSRCQRFDLRRIPDALIAAHLEKICKLEKVQAEPAALDAIARYAEGGLRDAESALDQVISFFGEKVREEDVLSMFGLSGLGPVRDLARAIAQADSGQAVQISRQLNAAGKDLGRLGADLLRFFRNVVVYQVAPDSLAGALSADEKAALEQIAPLLSRPVAMSVLEDLSHLETRLRHSVAKDVIFEVALLQLCQLHEKVSLEQILSRLAGQGGAAPAPSSSRPATAGAPAKSSAATIKPVTDPHKVWQEIVLRFSEKHPMEAATIKATSLLTVRADQFEVAIPTRLKNKVVYLANPRNLPLMEGWLAELCGQPMKLSFIVTDSNAAGDSSKAGVSPVKMDPKEFEADPLIHEAIELFQARITSIKPAAS
jgi:DNA polymerase-3 subunit gamma/tau